MRSPTSKADQKISENNKHNGNNRIKFPSRATMSFIHVINITNININRYQYINIPKLILSVYQYEAMLQSHLLQNQSNGKVKQSKGK